MQIYADLQPARETAIIPVGTGIIIPAKNYSEDDDAATNDHDRYEKMISERAYIYTNMHNLFSENNGYIRLYYSK